MTKTLDRLIEVGAVIEGLSIAQEKKCTPTLKY